MSSLGSNFFVLCTYTYSTNCAELACSIPLSVFNSPLCIFGCDCDHRQFCLSCFTSRLSLSNNICSECGSKVEALSYLAHNLVLNQFVENYCEINLETESDIPTESDNEIEVKLNNNYNNNYNNINYNNNSSISEDKKEKKIKRKRKKRNISASGPPPCHESILCRYRCSNRLYRKDYEKIHAKNHCPNRPRSSNSHHHRNYNNNNNNNTNNNNNNNTFIHNPQIPILPRIKF